MKVDIQKLRGYLCKDLCDSCKETIKARFFNITVADMVLRRTKRNKKDKVKPY